MGFICRLVGFTLAITVWALIVKADLTGDVNCDQQVNEVDADALVGALFETVDIPPSCAGPDVNADRMVSAADAVMLTRILGQPLPPPPTATPTPEPRVGPEVAYVGLAGPDGTFISPEKEVRPGNVRVFQRSAGRGFLLFVEAKPGPSGRSVATDLYALSPTTPTAFPDMQMEVSRSIGTGVPGVCTTGAIPGFNPADFSPTVEVARALNGLSCGFTYTTGPGGACTRNEFLSPVFKTSAPKTVQFCLQVEAPTEFPPGETTVMVQVRDVDGNVGPLQAMVVRVGPALTPTPSATASVTSSPRPTVSATTTATATSTPSATPTRTRTATASPTATLTPTASRDRKSVV